MRRAGLDTGSKHHAESNRDVTNLAWVVGFEPTTGYLPVLTRLNYTRFLQRRRLPTFIAFPENSRNR